MYSVRSAGYSSVGGGAGYRSDLSGGAGGLGTEGLFGQQDGSYQAAMQALTPPVPTVATKIMDGLFIGSMEASQVILKLPRLRAEINVLNVQDLGFLESNKVTRIINCAGQTVPNCASRYGVKYLTYRWPEHKGTMSFDPQVRDGGCLLGAV